MERHNRCQARLSVLLIVFTLFAVLGVYIQEASSAAYPNRPITLIVPMPPGGGTDLACRLLVKETEKILGQSIIVLNRPGGSQTIATAAVAAAKPDGYTIGYASHLGLFYGPLRSKVPYHPLKDLQYLLQFGSTNISVTVKGDGSFKQFSDVIAYARQNPKKLTYGSAGTGSLGHIGMEQIAKKEKVQFVHIPFKGSAETQTALLGGHILVGTGDFNYSLLEAGQIRLLFLIADNHSSEYPQTPILKDMGYDIPAPTLMSLIGPKGLPAGIVKKLEQAFTKAIKQPAFIKGMKELKYTIVYRNSKDVTDYVARSYEPVAATLKELGL